MRDVVLPAVVLAGLCLGVVGPAFAQDATWRANPGSNDFNTGTNWTGNAVPAGVATFGRSSTTDIAVTAPVTTVGALKFSAASPAYTFTLGPVSILRLTGAGIAGASSNAPTFNLSTGLVLFQQRARAGNAVINGTSTSLIGFQGRAGAGNATISLDQSGLAFGGLSSADNARIVAKNGSSVLFGARGQGGNADITVRGLSSVFFLQNATAGNATIHVGRVGGAIFFQNATGGTARFIVDRTGVVDFSGSRGQDGVVTAGSIEGDGQILIGNNFQVGGNNLSTEFAGRIGGCLCFGGRLTKVGTGTLILSGNNTYTGGTWVSGGTLQVDGSIARSNFVKVTDGGTLSGTGRVSDVVVTSGGTLAPGGFVGTLNVKGDLTFRDGSAYAIDVLPNVADRTDVSGTAKLNGTVFANVFGGQSLTRQFTILSATGGRTGRFDDLDLGGSHFLGSLRYTSTDVILNLTAALSKTGGLSGNQAGVSGAIDGYFNNGGTLPPAFVNVYGLNGAALGNALTQLSGEAATGAPTVGFQTANIFLNAMLDPFAGGTAAPGARAFASAMSPQAAMAQHTGAKTGPMPVAKPWTTWAATYGGKSYLDGDPSGVGSHSVDTGTYGVIAGADYRAGDSTWLGFAVAGGGNDWGLSNGLGGGDADSFQLGVYGVHAFGPAYVAAALGFGWHHVKTDRTVTIAGTDRLVANFDAQNLGARIEGGYRFTLPFGSVTPYAALQGQNYWLPSYGETAKSGAATFALNFQSQTVQALRTELGSWFESTHLVDVGVLALRGRVAWAHNATDDARLTATFQALPGANFVVAGAQAPEDAALLTGAAELRLPHDLTLSLRLDGEFAGSGQTYAATAQLRKAW